jgi:hypothetical protein
MHTGGGEGGRRNEIRHPKANFGKLVNNNTIK